MGTLSSDRGPGGKEAVKEGGRNGRGSGREVAGAQVSRDMGEQEQNVHSALAGIMTLVFLVCCIGKRWFSYQGKDEFDPLWQLFH